MESLNEALVPCKSWAHWETGILGFLKASNFVDSFPGDLEGRCGNLNLSCFLL